MTFNMWFHFSEPQFPLLLTGDDIYIYFIRLIGGLHDIIHEKDLAWALIDCLVNTTMGSGVFSELVWAAHIVEAL